MWEFVSTATKAKKRRRGVHMEPSLELKRFANRWEHIILECECGERMVILGGEEDWRSRNAIFKCGCGDKLTLADRLNEEVL